MAVPVAQPVAGANGKNGNGKANGATLDLPPLLPLDRVPQLPQVGVPGSRATCAPPCSLRLHACSRPQPHGGVPRACPSPSVAWEETAQPVHTWVAARRPCPLAPPPTPPPVPQDLCGIWAYIKWEVAGCPNRSKEEADREYEQGIQEMVMLLRR